MFCLWLLVLLEAAADEWAGKHGCICSRSAGVSHAVQLLEGYKIRGLPLQTETCAVRNAISCCNTVAPRLSEGDSRYRCQPASRCNSYQQPGNLSCLLVLLVASHIPSRSVLLEEYQALATDSTLNPAPFSFKQTDPRDTHDSEDE